MTTQFYDHEQIIAKVVSILQTNLPAKITAINTEKADAFTITNPEAYYFGFRMIDPLIGNNKSVIVVNSEMIEGINFNPGITDEEYTVNIHCILWSDKAEYAEKKSLRYARCIRQVLDENFIIDDFNPRPSNLKDSVVGQIEFNFLNLEGDVYAKEILVKFKIRGIFTYT